MASKDKSQSAAPDPVPKNSGPKISLKERLNDLVELVASTAEKKGWMVTLDAKDSKTHRYATISVSRSAADYQRISGTFEILSDERIKITYHKTSFYDWGLADLYDAISNEFYKLRWIKKNDKNTPETKSDVATIERFLRRFHIIARQLKHRHADRPGLIVNDEYDVQDLIHAILRGLYDDIRAEEYTPSYAGGSARMDFLLKSEKIVIEVKVASASLRDKQIGEQLLIDIGRYQSHQDCRRLICFVYDPSGHLKNPIGLEADLSKTTGSLEAKVIVVSV